MTKSAEPKWTPRPWHPRRLPTGDWSIRGPGSAQPVIGTACDEAHAHLFAASFDLYDALSAIIEGDGDSNITDARAALAKARGERP